MKFYFAHKKMNFLRILIERSVLFLADAIALALALYLSLDIADLASLVGTAPILALWMQQDTASHFISYTTAATLVVYWFWHRGHYTGRLPFWDGFGQLLGLLITGLCTEIGLIVLLSHAAIDWFQVLGSWGVSLVLIPVFRFSAKHALLKFGFWRRNAIIVGVGENGLAAHAALRAEPLMGYCVKWFARGPEDVVSPDQLEIDSGGDRLPLVDLFPAPAETLLKLGRPQIIVALDRITGNEVFVNQLGAISTNVLIFPSIRGLPLQGVEASHFFGRELLMLRIQNNLLRRGPRIIKRLFDVSISAVLLLLLSPFFLLLSLIIRRDGAAAIYGHTRIGLGGREFKCLKFRSMVANADELLRELLANDPVARSDWERDFKIKNDPRITWLGSFLRKSSLDELPQLINVLRGEMSLVGPRPVVRAELERYSEKIAYYLQVRPGITGLWQVSGRNDVDYGSRIGFDVWYVKNWSLWTDIVILLKTVRVVVFRIGAY